jgi:hypothetical protein
VAALAAVVMLRLVQGPLVVLYVPALIALLLIGFGHVGLLDEMPSLYLSAAAGLLAAVTGLALGVALFTGIREFAFNRTAVTEAWALNRAFSVLGSAAVALGGLVVGSRGLLVAAIPCYGLGLLLPAAFGRWRTKAIAGR